MKEYGEECIKYIANSKQLTKYLQRKAVASESSAITLKSRLNRLGLFIYHTYPGKSYDEVLADCKEMDVINPYDLLADYAAYLSKDHKPNLLRQKVKAAKKFLRSSGVKIDNEDFVDSVPLPRKEFPEFEGIDKSQIVELLNNTKNQRLKTALILFGATGCRAKEGCSVSLSNIDFDANTITFPARYTKTRKERTRPMTKELAMQLKTWLAIKYRPHKWVHTDGRRELVKPKGNPYDLVLAYWHQELKPTAKGVYDSLQAEYAEMTNLMGMKFKGNRRVVTFHSFRRFVKTTISDLGYGDYSEWYIGHSGSTYYRKTEKERLELFRKIESYLTFLDVTQLEARGTDQQTQLDQMQTELRKEREERAKLYELLYKQGIIKKE